MTLAPLRFLILLAATVVVALPVQAQTAAAKSDGSAGATAPAVAARNDQRIERIHIEDSGARIDELRVGGETRSITVAPKGNMPPYEVTPASANRLPSAGERSINSASGGTRVWKIFGF